MIHIATIVKDEAHRYLESAIREWWKFADDIIMFDDDSTDTSRDIATSAGCDVFNLFDNSDMWGNETPHRAALFNYAMRKADPDDVILWLDADMVPAKDPSKFFDVEGVEAWAFPLYDLWGKSHDSGLLYRADDYWDAHNNHRVWALRRPEEFDSTTIRWDGRGIHSGHIPSSWWDGLTRPPMIMPKDMALLHYGYFDDDDRSDRHKRYLSVKNQLTTHELAHAQTIIDPTPNLRTLQFTPDMTLNKP